jgi:hypothetical protein
MNYCKTCRYWESPWARQPGLGACARIEDDEGDAPITERAAIRFRVSDVSGIYAVNLVTMAAFGCVMHMPHHTPGWKKVEA